MTSKKTILYVDDDSGALETMRIGLKDRGYDIHTAGSGKEAIELLSTLRPDLIIVDLRMTPMNGFDLFQEIKKLPEYATTPFFFLTAVDDFLAQKYGQTLGVDAYLTKPVDINNLDYMIKEKLSAK